MIEDPLQSNEQRVNEVNNFQFALKNGNIVPVGPNEIKKAEVLPLPYDLEERRQKKADDQSVTDDVQIENNNVNERDENRDDEKLRQVLPPPKQNYEKYNDNKSSTNLPGNAIGFEIGKSLDDKKYTTDSPETRVSWLKQNKKSEINLEVIDKVNGQQTSEKVEEKLEKAQNNVDGILNQIMKMVWRIQLIGTCNTWSDLILLKTPWIIVLLVFLNDDTWKNISVYFPCEGITNLQLISWRLGVY